MKLYTCSNCKALLYFENNVCLNCQHLVGFSAEKLSLITLETNKQNQLVDISNKKDVYRYCENSTHNTCNWLVPSTQIFPFCRACELNRTIPALSTVENMARWKRIEIAKHRLVYSLLRLKLPLQAKKGNDVNGIAFDFLADVSPQARVLTGHDSGTITLNIEEADEAKRTRNKLDLGEKYRTLLGHFRHEVGHYYWEVLIKNQPALQKFRKLFGDEQKDYSQALQSYYQTGAPSNWMDHFISPYATAHPWEDWAETWSHYFHLMDTVETAYAYDIGIQSGEVKLLDLQTRINKDPYVIADFPTIIRMWIPLTFAINSLNRSMGHDDFYPFVISESIIEKLQFIHEVCAINRLKIPGANESVPAASYSN
ncbi:MAG: putative zinc-binding peptidase [Chitinophagaceae bacterium]